MGALVATVLGAGALFKTVDSAAPAVVNAAKNGAPLNFRDGFRDSVLAAKLAGK